MFWSWDEAAIPSWSGVAGGMQRVVLPPVRCGTAPFGALVVSWNATTPPGTVLTPGVRVRVQPAGQPSTWSPWYALARWGGGTHPETDEPLPRSLPVRRDGPGPAWVNIDTVRLKDGATADAFQVRVLARSAGEVLPQLHRLAVTTYQRGPIPAHGAAEYVPGPAFRLPVPERSQMVEDPALTRLICSPTSLGMVLAYYGVDQPTSTVVGGVRDQYGEETYGNWPFNTAYAATHGLQADVRHFADLDAVEAELRAGHPVILSVAWEEGELPAAPIRRSSGHLIVATGVDAAGDFLVNDPAANPTQGQPIARCYRRADLAGAFNGIGYVVAPREA